MSTERHGPIPITLAVPERLNSWKAIAHYLGVSVRTAQRWERQEQLPVCRHRHEADNTVYANRVDLEAWLSSRNAGSSAISTDVAAGRGLARWLALPALAVCIVCGAIMLASATHPDLAPDYRLRPFARALSAQWSPAWSPDGKTIAFIGENNGDRRLMVQAVSSPQAVAISPPSLHLADRQFPFWSPDSEWLYCVGAMERGDVPDNMSLYRVPARGGDAVLAQTATRAATISPDGRTLVTLSRSEDRNWRIWTATPPEGPRTRYQPEPILADAYFQ